jgi:hypothetical protein
MGVQRRAGQDLPLVKERSTEHFVGAAVTEWKPIGQSDEGDLENREPMEWIP